MCSTRSLSKPEKKRQENHTRILYDYVHRSARISLRDLFTISVSSTLSRDPRLRGGCHLSGLYYNDTHFILGFFSSTKEGPEHRQTTARTARVNKNPSNTFFAWWHTKVISIRRIMPRFERDDWQGGPWDNGIYLVTMTGICG